MAAGKKNAARLGAHIVFADESGFLLIPSVVKTWVPRGQTPVHRHRYRRDKISVISGVSVSPKRQRLGLFYRLRRTVRSPRPGDDDGSFVNAGYPNTVLNIRSSPYGDPNYHTAGDIPELCDVKNAAMAVQAALAAILTLDQER